MFRLGGVCHIASWALLVEAEFTCLSFVLNCQSFVFKLSVSVFILCPWPETAQDNTWKTIHTETQQFEQRCLKLSTREFGTGHRTIEIQIVVLHTALRLDTAIT